jgi:peptidoglycan/LPS O-acetylase OafA/YrhL
MISLKEKEASTVNIAKLVLCVFCLHSLGPVFLQDQLSWSGLWRDFSSVKHPLFYVFYPFSMGGLGVSVFFVLSGLVIHLSFLNKGSFNPKAFYWRRFWRIYPSYIVSIVFCVFLNRHYYGSSTSITQILLNLFSIQNISDRYMGGINGVFWSLCIEIQLYLLYPVVLLLRRKIGIHRTLLAAFSLAILLRLIFILVSSSSGRFLFSSEANFTFILWFDWILGSYIAELYFEGKRLPKTPPQLLALLFFAFFFSTIFLPAVVLTFSIASIISAILIEQYINSPTSISKIETMLLPLGLCSYSFYLWHFPLIYPLIRSYRELGMPSNPAIEMFLVIPVIFLIILALSWLMYNTIEKWGLRAGKYILSMSERRA